MKRILAWLGLFLGCSAIALGQTCTQSSQVILTGNLRSANGLPSSNSILTLTPSQAGFIAGCGVNLPTANTCATSTDGAVVGIQNPLTATIDTNSGTGTLPAGTYYTTYTFYEAVGAFSVIVETLPGPETVVTLSATGSIVVNPPSSGIPASALGMRVYIGSSSGGEALQGLTTGSASFVQSTALGSGNPLPTVNNTQCAIVANDTIWPTGTGYIVTMVDSSGNGIPGFPMQWQLMGAGTTINLSNGLPYYHGVVTYPVPVLTTPQNHGLQSISGPLSLTGYNLINAGKVGVGTSTPGWPVDVENGLINTNAGYLVDGAAGTTGQCLASDGTAFDTPVNCVTSLSSVFYQTALNGTTVGSALTQRNYFAAGLGTGLVASDVAASGPDVARTQIAINATTGPSNVSTDPFVVNSAGAGTSNNCAKWDAIGGLTDAGSPCASGTSSAVLNGYLIIPAAPNPIYEQWGTTSTLAANTPVVVSFPIAFPHACLQVIAGDNGPRVTSGNGSPLAASCTSSTTFTINMESSGETGSFFAVGW